MTDRRVQRAAPSNGRRRQEVLDAAAQVFYEKGYAAASTQDIADRIGILKGSLYYYVSSKEELLYEIIEQAHKISTRMIAEGQQGLNENDDRLSTIIRSHLQFYVDHREMATVYFREFRSLSVERRTRIDLVGHEYRSFVRQIIRDGQRDGSINQALDPDVVPTALVEMLNSLSRWFDPSGPIAADAVIDQYVIILTRGMAVPPSLTRPLAVGS